MSRKQTPWMLDVVTLFQKAYAEDAPNLDRQKERPPRGELTGIRVVVNEDTGEAYISNDQEEFFQILPDPEYLLRFVQQL